MSLDPAVWAAIIATGGGGIAGVASRIMSKRRQRIVDDVAELKITSDAREALYKDAYSAREARYDNLQQDLDSERKARQEDVAAERAARHEEVAAVRAAATEQANTAMAELHRQAILISNLGKDIRIRDDYIMELRQHISERRDPPPPAWPVSLTKST